MKSIIHSLIQSPTLSSLINISINVSSYLTYILSHIFYSSTGPATKINFPLLIIIHRPARLIHTNTHMHTHMHTHTHTHTHTCTHTDKHTGTHRHTHTHVDTFPHTRTRTCTHAYTSSLPLYISFTHIYTYTQTHSWKHRFLSDGSSFKDCGHPCESNSVSLRWVIDLKMDKMIDRRLLKVTGNIGLGEKLWIQNPLILQNS